MPATLSSILVLSLLLAAARTAGAQANGRGVEAGLDVLTASRSGEAAFYIGGFQGNQMMAFRFGVRDEREAEPCSAGVIYEYVGRRATAGRIKPTVGLAFSRIFSCATDVDVDFRPPPPQHGSLAISGGVRLAVFTGGKVEGSLKLLGYVEHLRGQGPSTDMTTHGLALGVAIHGR